MPCDRDQRGVGRAAHQGPVDHAGARARAAQAAASRGVGDVAQKSARDQPDRALPLSEVRSRADVGGGRAAGRASAAARCCSAARVERIERAGRRVIARRRARSRDAARSTTLDGDYVVLDHAGEGLVAGLDPPAAGRGAARSPRARRTATSSPSACCVDRARRSTRGTARPATTASPDNWIYIQEPDVRSAGCRSSTTGARTWCADPRHGLARPRVLLQRGRRALAHAGRRAASRSRPRELEQIGIVDARRRARRHGHPRAEDLPGLLRHLRRSSTRPRAWLDAHRRTCSWSAATACTATTTRTTRC